MDNKLPIFSVKIPTYNCAKYLIQTIESVLKNDLGEVLMEIEVIDDCSTLDDPKTITTAFGRGRVKYFRQQRNVGIAKNFNTCISRSKGKYIHILHGDDIVNEGFYSKYLQVINKYPEVALISSKTIYIDEYGNQKSLQEIDRQKTTPFSGNNLIYGNIFTTPSVVVRSDIYKNIGNFNEELSHTADWEMWMRIVNSYKAIFIDEYLASWRDFGGNDTKKSFKEGRMIKDLLRTIEIAKSYIGDYDENSALSFPRKIAINGTTYFYLNNELEAYFTYCQIRNKLLRKDQIIIENLKNIYRKYLKNKINKSTLHL